VRQKKFIIAGGFFLLLLIYVLISQTGNKGFSTLELPQLPVVKAEEIEKIIVEKGDEKIVFEKQSGAWQLLEPIVFPVDPGKGSSLERLLGELRITNMITRRSEAEADFGLATTTAMHVMIAGKAGVQLELYVGRVNEAKTHTYIRLPGKTGVYSLLGDITQQLNQDAKQWRSLKIYDFSTDTIRKIQISQKGRLARVVAREEVVQEQIVKDGAQAVTPAALPAKMVWKDQQQGSVLPDAEVSRFLNAFARLSASKILDDAVWDKKILALIEVGTPDKNEMLELLKKTEQGHFWARRQGEKTIYEISDYQGKNLLTVLKLGK